MPADWLEHERRHVWHPYASIGQPAPVYPVRRAQGVMLELEDGRRLIDGMASWWCAIHGYNVPELNDAACRQLERMSHVMFGGLTHEPAARLAEKLLQLAPSGMEHVFFADSGSVSVEVAIKMAIQYWQAQGHKKKHRLLTLRHGYHGDTFGAMSVCDPVSGMHHLFSGLLPQHLFAKAPANVSEGEWNETDLDDFTRLLQRHRHEIAAVILEPVVQGAGGMRVYHPEFLAGVRRLCDETGVLLIADEIATGFGRSGTMFACEQAGVSPDIMCVGKALTGGYMTLAAVLCSARVARGVEAAGHVLMHGPTFMANPLACSVALASIGLLQARDWQRQVQGIEAQLKEGLMPARALSQVADVRVKGAIGVLEMRAPVDVTAVQRRLIDQGVWLRPFGRLIYTMPPYVITREELARLTAAMLAAAEVPLLS